MECYIPYTGKFWWGETFANLANRELFAKIFLTNIHIYTENVFGTLSSFAKFFLANSLYNYLYGLPKFFCVWYYDKIFIIVLIKDHI